MMREPPKGARLFIDIETIPTQSPRLKEYVSLNLKAPRNYTKQEAIDKWILNNAEKAWRDTALDGAFGELVSVAWAFNDEPITGLCRSIGQSEQGLLERLWDGITKDGLPDVGLVWVGHKLMFDMLFLHQRSIVNGLYPPLRIPYSDRAWAGTWEDTNVLWTGSDYLSSSISLDKLCAALDIPSPKEKLDGAHVWDAIKAGNYREVMRYNIIDVETVRFIYKRLTGVADNY